MRLTFRKIISAIKSNKNVAESYFFMTAIQILNSLFYFLLYPFIIRIVGPTEFGKYIFAMAITSFFINIVNYGFDMPSIKVIAQNSIDRNIVTTIVSEIITARVYLLILSIIIFITLSFTVPFFKNNLTLLWICFLQVFSTVFFPRFYFEAIQNLKKITAMQALSKIITLPLIYIFIRSKNDISNFALINSFGVFMGSIFSLNLFYRNEKKIPNWCSLSSILGHFKIGFPFFLTQTITTIKEQSIILILGSLFGMREVAYYDLANKLIMVPRTFIMSINNALFPKIVKEWQNKNRIKKIIRYEFILGLLLIFIIIAVGKPAIYILGGEEMLSSYHISIILSVTILSWLVVSAYINFVFIPQNKLRYITINQILALMSFTIFCLISIFFLRSIYTLALSLAVSGLLEIVFCYYLVKKFKFID